MEKRIHKRKIVSLNVELIAEGKRYAGIVENITEDGLYMIANPSKTSCVFSSETKLELKFQLNSGKILHLPCKVTWSYKTPPHGLTNSIGMEIIDPPLSYKESLKALI